MRAARTIAFSKAGRVMMSRGLMSRFISSSNALPKTHSRVQAAGDLKEGLLHDCSH